MTPRARAPVAAGMVVRVVRVEARRLTVVEPLRQQTLFRYDDGLAQGKSRVLEPGRIGLVRRMFLDRFEDGRPVGRILVAVEVLREPVSRVLVLGTKETGVEVGVASWYERTGMTAAHPWLPFGTRVTVTSLATGPSVTVVINDRGPFVEGRIIDLSDDAFARLAPFSSGVCTVRITW